MKEPDPPQGYGLPRAPLVIDTDCRGSRAGSFQEREGTPVIFSSLEFADAWVTRDALKILVCRPQQGLIAPWGLVIKPCEGNSLISNIH